MLSWLRGNMCCLVTGGEFPRFIKRKQYQTEKVDVFMNHSYVITKPQNPYQASI